jgi:CHAT domain-containing protein/tetratricopeptide (TPR) repeat protein
MVAYIRRKVVLVTVFAAIWPITSTETRAQSPEQARVLEFYRRGEAFWGQRRVAEAIREYEQAVALAPAAFGERNITTADLTNNLAHIYTEAGLYAKAEPLYLSSLAVRELVKGPDSREVAISLNNLGELYRQMGRFDQAEPMYRRCLAIKEAKLGPDHPNVALTLNNLADLYRDMRRFAEAEPLYRRCLAILEPKLEPNHPQLATTLDNLAHLYGRMDRYDEAIPLAQRALAIFETKYGPDHRDTAICVNNLGAMYEGAGRFADAERLYLRSLAVNEEKVGREHPDVIMNWDNLGRLSAEMGRWAEALQYMDRAQRALRRHVDRVLPALSEPEQLSFLRNKVVDDHHGALGLGLTRRDDPAAVSASAGWVLNGKALAQQSLAQRALLARDSQDERLAGVVEQLNAVRNQLAMLTLATPGPGQEADRRERLGQLAGREQELSKQLSQARGNPGRDDPWVGLDEVRAALPPDTALVEIARFRVWNFQGQGADRTWQSVPRYAAWIIPAAGPGETRLIDLGPAGPIEQAVAAVRQSIQPGADALASRGEPEVETQVRGPLRDLADLVLRPLLSHIRTTRRWIISPDAALWLIPWAALPLDGTRYAIEDHPIQFVVSGRDLAQSGARSDAGPALVMADPDFDLDPAQARDAAQQVLRDPSRRPPDPDRRGLANGLVLGSVARLPGTAAEAKAIAPGLRDFAKAEPIIYSDRWALEAVFKAFRRPRAIVMSTHGFFLDEPESRPEHTSLLDLNRVPRSSGEPLVNPLLRCGLLLAGCNQRGPAADGEDGVLTGMEIVGTDLRGSELVVLSACETAVGQVRNGEGVAGLRQAFQLAGAQTVVATLWQVPDRESARLMVGFFDNLVKGQGKAEALRQAQLSQIQSRRQRYGAAHPFFWAAYTLTGRGE